jgi:hypothetical protein
MKYRDAKNLRSHDIVIRKSDKAILKVISIEIYGQFKLVRINAKDINETLVSIYQNDVE